MVRIKFLNIFSLLTKYPKDAYLSLGCSYHKDDCLNSNEPIEDALELVKRLKPPSLKGIGVNCTKPQYISIFGKLAARILPDLTLIAYPNSGEEYHQDGSSYFTNFVISLLLQATSLQRTKKSAKEFG